MSAENAEAISLMRGPLVGTFLGSALYGISCMQAFFYFQTYENDSRRLKMMVAILLIMETAYTATSMWAMDDYLVAHFGNTSILERGTGAFAMTYIIGFIIDFYVYLYFTWRIWLFSTNKWIFFFMCTMCISRVALGIYYSLLGAMHPTWVTGLEASRTVFLAMGALFIAGDTFSASVMAYYLAKSRSWLHNVESHRPRRMETVINRLLMFAVATGALTSVMGVIILILGILQPHGLAFLGPAFVQLNLYSNSVLASLNIRNSFAPKGYGTSDIPAGFSLQFRGSSNTSSAVSNSLNSGRAKEEERGEEV